MHYEQIIIGAGSMGSAAAYFLGKAGKRVLLIDAHHPPHTEGSHHGETRLIRFAYGEGERYVPFVLRAKQLWDELAVISGKANFLQTGIVNVGEANDPFIQGVERASDQYNLPLQKLTASELMEKFSGMQIPSHLIGLYEPSSGVMLTEACIESYIEQACKYDVTKKFDTKIQQIEIEEGIVKVYSQNGECYTADHCICTVGAWAKELLEKTGIILPMQPTRKTFAWFEADESIYGDMRYPGFTFQFHHESYYGFPSIDGKGLKIGRHDTGQPINPNDEKTAFGLVDHEQQELEQFLHTYMPQVGKLIEGKTCMYAMTPDEDFIIDQHPIYPQITFAAGFSGHGFKFASAVGEALSELAQGMETTIDLSAFTFARFNR